MDIRHVAAIVLLVVAVGVIVVVAGCGGVDSIGQHKEYVTHMGVDGKQVPCVELRTDHGASIDCDWGR